MYSLLACDDGPIAMAAIVFGSLMIMFVAGTALTSWRRGRTAGYEAKLKQLMIERGMTADEIISVIAAGADIRSKRSWLCSRNRNVF